MTGSPPEKPFYESLGFKTAVAVVIILIFIAIFVTQRRPGQTSGTSGTGQRQMGRIGSEPQKLPAPEARESLRHQYPLEGWSDPGNTASPMSGQTDMQPMPRDSAPVAKTQAYPLSAPTTQVHSLSEAGAVMGQPAGDVGEVGVTRTYELPDQTQGNKNPTRSGDPKRP